MILIPHIISDRAAWNDIVRALPYAHILQSWEWGEFKRVTTGWNPQRIAFERDGRIVAAASVGVRRIPHRHAGVVLMYAPKGPALDYADIELAASVLDYLQRRARRMGAVWLKIDPDVRMGTGVPGEADETSDAIGARFAQALKTRGWRFSADQVQFRNTVGIDLTPTEDAILAAMGQSTRRKIRLAEREGVTVRAGTAEDIPLLYDLYKVTGARDQFVIRPPEYYAQAWRAFIDAGLAQPLIAEYEGKALAHVILFHFARTCWYFYGASSDEARDKMPNYLLQWTAIQWAKARGYTTYDFWGAPNEFTESDSMWGVYQFKRGFHGTVVRHIGAWDCAPYPPLYRAYTELMPRIIARLRRR
ncbi:MAG: peptidoglycan bridge formation glycyltransferase FemA/FemB family protein [Chloroflexota bacterium]|nr:peptidoglycan bridge formation glycyltransferase FemA/FemB family protein [Chloroflexota bacterium]